MSGGQNMAAGLFYLWQENKTAQNRLQCDLIGIRKYLYALQVKMRQKRFNADLKPYSNIFIKIIVK